MRPPEPEIIGPNGIVTLASIGFAAPLAAFYRTTALATRTTALATAG